MSENDLKLAGTNFETKGDNGFNVVNANDAMLIAPNITTYKCFLRTSRGAEGGPL